MQVLQWRRETGQRWRAVMRVWYGGRSFAESSRGCKWARMILHDLQWSSCTDFGYFREVIREFPWAAIKSNADGQLSYAIRALYVPFQVREAVNRTKIQSRYLLEAVTARMILYCMTCCPIAVHLHRFGWLLGGILQLLCSSIDCQNGEYRYCLPSGMSIDISVSAENWYISFVSCLDTYVSHTVVHGIWYIHNYILWNISLYFKHVYSMINVYLNHSICVQFMI